MGKAGKKNLIKWLIITMVALALGVGAFFFVTKVILVTPEIIYYGFSGYVYADGVPLKGAIVSCGAINTETDDNGYYNFDNLSRVVEVTVFKDGYIFGNELVFVNKDSENINFNGYELFDMYGVVEVNEVIVPFAKVKVSSIAGTFETMSNEFGEFYLPRLAGIVELNATSDTMNFFSQTFDKCKSDLILSGTTNVSGKIIPDDDCDFDFVLTLDGEVVEINADNTFELSNVSPNQELVISSNNYHITDSKIKIDIENQEINFDAYKYYTLTGVVGCGNRVLSNIKIDCNGLATISNNLGEFEINNIYGDCEVIASYGGYNFDKVQINKDNCSIAINGFFDLSGVCTTDDNILNGIEFVLGNKVATTNIKGEFNFKNVSYGDVIALNSPHYDLIGGDIIVDSNSLYSVELKKLYMTKVFVVCDDNALENVEIIIDTKSYLTNSDGCVEINNLSGFKNISCMLNGYYFENDYVVDYLHNDIEITAFQIFAISGIVHSGNVILDGAKVSVNGVDYYANNDGKFEVCNLHTSGNATIVCDGYNNKVVNYSMTNNVFDIELSYDVYGVIVCGNSNVAYVDILIDDTIVGSTNFYGEFQLANLIGEKIIRFNKDYYSIDSVVIARENVLNIDSTYSISGVAFNNSGNISGLLVTLVKDADNILTVYTDENGLFGFEDLSGDYILYYDTNRSTLLPDSYEVSVGGKYNFSDSGYKISGTVTCGGIPVVGVTVSAGDNVTTTNVDGHYKFNLLIGEEVLHLSKDGYTFINNDLSISGEFDKRDDVDFESTYEIYGKVYSGNVPIENAQVLVGERLVYTNKLGEYLVSGLSGNVAINVSFDGYSFDGVLNVNGYGEYDFQGYYDISFIVKTGDVLINGVKTMYDNVAYYSAKGEITINGIVAGSSFVFEKDGYLFDVFESDGYTDNSIQILGSYSFGGIVYCGANKLAGVMISCGGQNVVSNDNGEFTFSGLIGSHTLIAIKDGFEFDNINVDGAESKIIYAKFGVSGYVTVGGVGVDNVKITAGDIVTYTDNSGYYTINNLTVVTEIVPEKMGYDFGSGYFAYGLGVINIFGSYMISGTIRSGDIRLANAYVVSLDGNDVYADSNGYFEISGLNSVTEIRVTCDGYKPKVIKGISGYNNSIDVDLNYDVVLTLLGVTTLNEINVSVNGEFSVMSGASIILTDLVGENLIILSKNNYIFTPSQLVVSSNTNASVSVKFVYTVMGKITTDNGIPVSGAIVTAGANQVTTNASGDYVFSLLSDTVQLKLKLMTNETLYEVNIDQVSSACTKDFVISNYNYAFYMFKRGYYYLDIADSYQIFGGGTVKTSATSDSQNVRIVYKKDNTGKKIIQNLNHGSVINAIVIKVDPRVAQLTYYDTISGSVKYQTISGDKVGSNFVGQYSTNWTDVDKTSYLNSHGVDVDGYFPYVVNNNTISSISNIVDNGETYSFTITLKMVEEMYHYYIIQMSKMCSSQSFSSFTNCYLKYTIYKSGFIKSVDIDEVYKVTAMSVSATVTDDFTYNFYTTGFHEIISNIDVSSAGAITNSLQLVTPTQLVNSNFRFDIIDDKRRVLA